MRDKLLLKITDNLTNPEQFTQDCFCFKINQYIFIGLLRSATPRTARLHCAAMCVLLPAWMWLLLGFLPLEVQSRAVTLQSLTHRQRSSLPRTSKYPKSINTAIMPIASDLSAVVDNYIPEEDRHIIWRALLHKESPPRLSDTLLDQRDSVLWEAPVWQHGSRGRRHANSGGGRGHSHLMRVGCVLGTCQVQNLSHRLYQLIGQSGREDSSPINPRSPHSYG